MTSKHELVNEPSAPNADSFYPSYSNETSFSPQYQRDFSFPNGTTPRYEVGRTLPRDSFIMIESQSPLNHRVSRDGKTDSPTGLTPIGGSTPIGGGTKTLPVYGYPNLETLKEEEHFKDYKINKIGEYIKYLDTEIKDRERLKKNYGKLDKTLFGVECSCMITELGVTGASFFVPPMVVITTPICLGLTVFSTVIRNGSKLITKKIDKHAHIELLAKSKRNSIDEKYTKAMEDGVISESEFQDIRKEIYNYDEMKKSILNQFKNNSQAIELTKEAQLTLINKGKEEMKEEFKIKLNKL